MTLRFGILATQLDMILPKNLATEQALVQVAGFEQADHIRKLHEKGFNLIELSGDLALFLPHTFQPPAIEKVAALKQETDLSFTVHLPLWSVEPSTPLAPVRQGSVQALIDAIKATQKLDPEVYVLHATGALSAEFYRMQLPDVLRLFLLRQFQTGARQSIQMILQETGLPSRKLAVETIEFPLDLTLELADELDLSLCFDTGHVLVGFSGPTDLFEALEQCLPRLAEVHLHDGPQPGPDGKISYGKDHQALGKGDLDVGRFLDRLAESDFSGPIIFELTIAEAFESLKKISEIRPEVLPK